VILIDATYLNSGGGLVLLQELMLQLRGCGNFALLRDIRVTDLDTCGWTVYDVPPRESARRRFYRRHQTQITKVLCLGNVPPPVKLAVPVVTYFHNLLLCQAYPQESWSLRGDSWLKMRYISFRQGHTDAFWVQSNLVAKALRSHLDTQTSIEVLPFYRFVRSVSEQAIGRFAKFAYVSDGHPHKNHLKLIAAWGQLAQQGLYPELHLTVGAAHVELLKVISVAQQQGLKVINHGYTQPSKLYAACGYQIYPSILESFGLGLIEAAQAGCAVLASDLPYVTEIIRPWKVFNPDDAASIASTVATCYQKPAPASEVLTPNRIDAIRDWLVSSIQTSTRTHS
jgi:glycosyltransferase involved in cell wall biosynthesis